jgi:hypothetical protein
MLLLPDRWNPDDLNKAKGYPIFDCIAGEQFEAGEDQKIGSWEPDTPGATR